MRRGGRIALWLGGGFAALLLVALAAVLVLKQTDWGRERVRRLALEQVAGSVNGRVRIGRISGNLLSGVTLDRVVITDSAGAPFLRADTVSLGYSLRSLLSKRILLRDLRLVRPVIVLEKRPGEEWNFVRIFPSDTTPADTAARGFGSWVRISNLRVRDGRLLVRNEWLPDDSLAGAARDSAVAAALSPESRLRVVRVAGGFQSIQDFRALDAHLPLLRLADPDSANIRADIARLSTVAYPFRPPAARIRNLAGRFEVGPDSLWFRDLRVALPESRLAAEGVYLLESGNLQARLRAAPVRLGDLRWILPTLPDSGGGSLQLAVARRGERTHVVARDLDLRLEGATLAGFADIVLGDSLRFGPTDLRFAGVDTRLAERFAPDADLPVDGTAAGRLALRGRPDALRLDGRVAFTERGGGTSRVFADGRIGTADGFRAEGLRLRFDPVRVALARGFAPDLPVGGIVTGTATLTGSTASGFDVDADLVHRDPQTGRSRLLADGRVETADGFAARDLVLRFDPLQVELARAFAPDLPVGGTLSGRATVNGSADTRIAADLDLTHRGADGVSRLVGDARVAFGEPQRFDVELRAPVLALGTVGRFAPAAGLRGSGSGTLRARGTVADLDLALRLGVDGGGELRADGRFDLASPQQRYDFTARFADFDAAALSTRAPQTALTGTIAAQGRGVDPATLRATLRADLRDARVDSVEVDAARLLVRVADGLARVERGTVRLASARAEVQGSFGLAAGRSGTLRYRVAVDSLSDFAAYLPRDTAAATEAGDSATAASPSGSVRAEGTLAGNLARFDVRGTAALEEVVVGGNAVQHGRAQYTLLGGGTPGASLALEAGLDSVRAGGLALDSVRARVRHRQGPRDGTADLLVFGDTEYDARLRADYQLGTEGGEVRLSDVLLRLDSTRWTSTQPGTVRWGGPGLQVEALELTSGTGGRIYANGRLPSQGEGNLELVVDRLQIGDFAALLQDTAQVAGLLSLRARVSGTQADPRIRAETRLAEASYGGTDLPALRADLAYADTELRADASLLEDGRPVVVAAARVPVNLAFSGVQGERLLDRRLVSDVRMDSLALETLPQLSDAISELQGRLAGNLAVRGTAREPELNGAFQLSRASVRLPEQGLQLAEMEGALRLRGDEVVIDSLVARSDGGPIRLAGTLDISTPAEPGFDLALTARDARVLNNEQGRIRADAELAVEGPFNAVRVTGDLRIREGDIFVPETDPRLIDLEDPAPLALIDRAGLDPDGLLARNTLLETLRVDVALRIRRNTWVRTPAADVEIYTPDDAGPLALQLDRGDATFTLDGLVNTDRGEYEFSGRRFDLTSGAVTFIGGQPINPLLQITAEHQVPRQGREALAIQINIGGTLEEPRVTLESNAQPPLPQSDLIAYLAFGESSSSLLSTGGSGLNEGGGDGGGLGALATQKLTAIALGALVNDAVEDLERSGSRLGLDVVRVSPAEIPSELQFDGAINLARTTELELGSYLTPRWFVATQGRATALPGVRVEYRTPAGFRWVTTWEPRYLPSRPSFADDGATQNRVLGTFLLWEWRY